MTLSTQDKVAIKKPCHRLFYISSEALGHQISSSWHDTQREIELYLTDVLNYYQADYITYHNYTASGIAYMSLPDLSVAGFDCEAQEIEGEPVWIRTPDVRYEIGKTLRADLRKINSLREDAPDFGPYCVSGLGLSEHKTLSMNREENSVVMQYCFAGIVQASGQVLLSIPVGGADDLRPPQLGDEFREITEKQYLDIVYAAELTD